MLMMDKEEIQQKKCRAKHNPEATSRPTSFLLSVLYRARPCWRALGMDKSAVEKKRRKKATATGGMASSKATLISGPAKDTQQIANNRARFCLIRLMGLLLQKIDNILGLRRTAF